MGGAILAAGAGRVCARAARSLAMPQAPASANVVEGHGNAGAAELAQHGDADPGIGHRAVLDQLDHRARMLGEQLQQHLARLVKESREGILADVGEQQTLLRGMGDLQLLDPLLVL